MKKITLFLYTLLIALTATAQPSDVQKAAKAVLSLTTFDQAGNILGSSYAVCIGPNGEAVSTWKPFIGAAKAVVVDAEGKQMNVKSVFGASELYDICKFRVDGQPASAPVATAAQTAGSKAWLVNYSVKKAKCKQYSIASVEKFSEKYNYYLFSEDFKENMAGCPMVNDRGQVIGIVQPGEKASATDAAFAAAFEPKGLSINDAVLRTTNIRVALPKDLNDAQLMFMISSEKRDSALYMAYAEEFVQQFPGNIDGYSAQAQAHMLAGQYAQADDCMQKAIANCTHKDEAHSSYAQLISQKLLLEPDSTYPSWTLQKALSEAQQASQINPLPIYEHQQAQIIYNMGDTQKAYDMFMKLTDSNIRSGELYYEAARCKMVQNAPQEEIITLLDSAVSVQGNNQTAAPYYFARGQYYDNIGKPRKAIADYNKYDTLMLGRASHQFYYIKYKCESKIHQYQQALNDIAHAVVLNRTEPTYYAEMASLQLKVNQLEDAIRTCDLCLHIDSEYADPYIIKGVALAQLNRKDEALQALQKAKDLGDERAEPLIEKYK